MGSAQLLMSQKVQQFYRLCQQNMVSVGSGAGGQLWWGQGCPISKSVTLCHQGGELDTELPRTGGGMAPWPAVPMCPQWTRMTLCPSVPTGPQRIPCAHLPRPGWLLGPPAALHRGRQHEVWGAPAAQGQWVEDHGAQGKGRTLPLPLCHLCLPPHLQAHLHPNHCWALSAGSFQQTLGKQSWQGMRLKKGCSPTDGSQLPAKGRAGSWHGVEKGTCSPSFQRVGGSAGASRHGFGFGTRSSSCAHPREVPA